MPRGKKSCPECQALVGPRLRVCECGFEFVFKPGKAPKKPRVKLSLDKPHEKLTENPSEVVGISDRDALDSFIEQLKDCRNSSSRAGGCYTSFLHHKQGTLAVEVWLK